MMEIWQIKLIKACWILLRETETKKNLIWGTRVAQRWEHSPLTSVAGVQILALTPHVGWVCCWFSPLLRESFLWVLWFFPSPQKPTFQNSNLTMNPLDEEPLRGCAISKLLLSFLSIIIMLIFMNIILKALRHHGYM